jgi:hypothetical protein
LGAGQLLTNSGSSNIAVTMSGDATFSSTGLLTIATNAITAAKIMDSEVTSIKIADNSITSTKILDGAVDTNDLANSSVTSAKILDGTILANDLANSAVTSIKIADGTIATVDIANNAVNDAKISSVSAGKLLQSGATTGQVLKWNGTAWIPEADNNSGGTVTQITAGTGLSGGSITSSGTIAVAAGGVTATELADNAVTSAKILDGTIVTNDIANTAVTDQKIASVSPAKILSSGATPGQVLKWNGTAWIPDADNTNAGTVTNIATGSGLTGGPITGTGTIAIATSGVTTTHLADNAVTSVKIADGTIQNADLANGAVTDAKITGGASAGLVLTTTSPGVAAWQTPASSGTPDIASVLSQGPDAKNQPVTNLTSVSINTASTKGALNVMGSQFVSFTDLPDGGSYSVKDNDYILIGNSRNREPYLVYLPNASENAGRVVIVRAKNIEGSSGVVVVASDGLDGNSQSPVLNYTVDKTSTPYAITVFSDGKTWWTISTAIH